MWINLRSIKLGERSQTQKSTSVSLHLNIGQKLIELVSNYVFKIFKNTPFSLSNLAFYLIGTKMLRQLFCMYV